MAFIIAMNAERRDSVQNAGKHLAGALYWPDRRALRFRSCSGAHSRSPTALSRLSGSAYEAAFRNLLEEESDEELELFIAESETVAGRLCGCLSATRTWKGSSRMVLDANA